MEEQNTNDSLARYGEGRAPSNGMIAVEQQRSLAEVQAAVIMARQFPRDAIGAMQRIRMACQRPTLAESATYTYAKGGANVTGPSIRLAEALAQQWGNLQFGIRELSQGNGESTVEAYAWDLETNVRQSKVFQVKHERHVNEYEGGRKTGRQNVKRITDPREIYEMAANNGARRLRACILGIIPGDVVEDAVNECEATLKTNVELTPAKVQAMLEYFESHKITKAMVEERIQRPMDSITPALFVGLRKIANSLKDGMSKPGDWFKGTEAVVPETKSMRLSVAQMKAAQEEVEKLGASTSASILEKYPNLPEDQRLIIATWEYKEEAK